MLGEEKAPLERFRRLADADFGRATPRRCRRKSTLRRPGRRTSHHPRLRGSVSNRPTGSQPSVVCTRSCGLLAARILTIEQIAIEQNADQTHSSNCFATARLAEVRMSFRKERARRKRFRCRARRVEAAAGGAHSRYIRFSCRTLNGCDTPVVVKVVAADRQGRRTTGWAIVPPRRLSQAERLVQHVP